MRSAAVRCVLCLVVGTLPNVSRAELHGGTVELNLAGTATSVSGGGAKTSLLAVSASCGYFVGAANQLGAYFGYATAKGEHGAGEAGIQLAAFVPQPHRRLAPYFGVRLGGRDDLGFTFRYGVFGGVKASVGSRPFTGGAISFELSATRFTSYGVTFMEYTFWTGVSLFIG